MREDAKLVVDDVPEETEREARHQQPVHERLVARQRVDVGVRERDDAQQAPDPQPRQAEPDRIQREVVHKRARDHEEKQSDERKQQNGDVLADGPADVEAESERGQQHDV